MTGLEIAALVLKIVEEAVAVAGKLLAEGVAGKKPEEVQASLHGLIDRHLEPWLPLAVKPADDLFNHAP